MSTVTAGRKTLPFSLTQGVFNMVKEYIAESRLKAKALVDTLHLQTLPLQTAEPRVLCRADDVPVVMHAGRNQQGDYADLLESRGDDLCGDRL